MHITPAPTPEEAAAITAAVVKLHNLLKGESATIVKIWLRQGNVSQRWRFKSAINTNTRAFWIRRSPAFLGIGTHREQTWPYKKGIRGGFSSQHLEILP